MMGVNAAPVPGGLTHSVSWYSLVLWRFLKLSGRGLTGVWPWLRTRTGHAALALLGVAATLGILFMAETFRQLHVSADRTEPRAVAPSVPSSEDPVLATLNGAPITLADVVEYGRQEGRLGAEDTLTPMAARDRGLLDDLIDQQILAAAAEKSDVASQPEVQRALRVARRRILTAAFLERIVDEAATEEAARALYAAQRENIAFGDEVRLDQILVGDALLAQELRAALDGGAPFADLASEHSIDPASALRKGDAGYFAYGQLPEAIAETAFALERGGIAGPFETARGYLIIRQTGRRRVTPPSFEALQPEILEFLRLDAIAAAYEDLRSTADILYIDDAFGEATSPTPSLAVSEDKPVN